MDIIGILGILLAFFFGLACGEIKGEARVTKMLKGQQKMEMVILKEGRLQK